MNVAVATNDGMVSGHFGHCEAYTLFQVEEGNITGQRLVPAPEHKPGYLPVFLSELGANVIIAGGMGAKAIALFDQKNIEVVTGAQGKVRDAAEQYLQGTLRSSGAVCHEHAHHGDHHA